MGIVVFIIAMSSTAYLAPRLVAACCHLVNLMELLQNYGVYCNCFAVAHCLSVRPSVRLSVTFLYSVETNKFE